MQPTEQAAPDSVSSQLYSLHGRAVLAACLAQTGNLHDAEDIMQAVFAKVIANIQSLRDPQRAMPWIMQIARRACIDHHRRRRPMAALPPEVAAPPAGDGSIRADALHQAIHKLPRKYRDVIVLYYLAGHSSAAVAAYLGASPAGIRQRLVRARMMLHGLLREDQP